MKLHTNISLEKPPKCSFICNWFAMLGITWNKYFQFRGWKSSWNYWEEVKEAPTRNCTNDCSCCDEGNDQGLFQPVIHLLCYVLCIDWKSLKAPWVKDIDVAHWNVKKQPMRANWNSYTFHSQHLEMYIRFEHYSLPTPLLSTPHHAYLTHAEYKFTQTKQCHRCTGHYLAKCLAHEVWKILLCSWRKDRSLHVQPAPQCVTEEGNMYCPPALFSRYLYKKIKTGLC